jgi:phosphoribosylformimino-5-aminoimidazole carboxamide ribotide isomerase
MLAIPKVEIRGGFAVRAAGSGSGSTLGDAVLLARGFAHSGFHRIHVLDTEVGTGGNVNAMVIEDIIRDGAIEVQAADAPESADRIEQLVEAGAVSVVVGPRGLDEPDWLAGAAELYPGLLVVATDVRARRVTRRGWVRALPVDILDLVQELNGLPLGGLLVSDGSAETSRGALDLSLLEDVAEACEFPVIAGDGVFAMNDLRALEHRGISAVLLGDLLYSGELDPRSIASEFGEL